MITASNPWPPCGRIERSVVTTSLTCTAHWQPASWPALNVARAAGITMEEFLSSPLLARWTLVSRSNRRRV